MTLQGINEAVARKLGNGHIQDGCEKRVDAKGLYFSGKVGYR